MAMPLLQTKLYIPQIYPADLVSRSRLLESLNAGLHRKLTLICAPAGFGKTTLVSDWLRKIAGEQGSREVGEKNSSPTQVAWFSLDEADNDPARFWTYIIAALQRVEAELGAIVLASLQSPQSPPIETLLTELINQLAALSKKVVLVLDDYHLIENQAIHQALTFWLSHVPSQLHLVIISRSDPPLPLARLRGRRQLNEIRAPDLRFTVAETGAFFSRIMSLDLTSEAIETLEARTEGWAVGLQLAGLALQGRTDVAGFITAFAGDHSYLIDYLTDEVFAQQPELVQTFLLQTAILERLSGPLCDHMLASSDWRLEIPGQSHPPLPNRQSPGQEMLAYLAQNNLFVIPLDERRQWYRYHHLFADLLRYRLKETYPDRVSDLHQRASAWYAGHNFIDEALHHAFAAADFKQATDLLEAVSSTLSGQGRMNTLQQWLERLPEPVILACPRLCVRHAWALNFAGHPEAVERRLQDAERALQTGSYDQQTTAEVRGNAAVLRSYPAYRQNNLSLAAQLLEEALTHLPQDEQRLRSVASLRMGMIYKRQKAWEAADKAFRQAQALGSQLGYLYVVSSACGQLAEMLIERGQLSQAARLCRRTLTDYEVQHQQGPFPNLSILIRLGYILYEWHQLEAAATYLNRAIEQSKQIMLVWQIVLEGLMRLAWIKQVQGELDEAQTLLRQAIEKADQLQVAQAKIKATAWQARLNLTQGNLAAANRWAQSYQAQHTNWQARDEEAEMILARIFIAQNAWSQALEILDPLGRVAEAAGCQGRLIEVLALKGLVYQAQQEPAQALSTLAQALDLAEAEGYIRTFVDEGPPMRTLLSAISGQRSAASPAYIDKLLAAFTTEEPFTSLSPCPSAHPLPEPLNEREMEVLRLLAAGLKTPEIATELILAPSTIKWYLRNIYSKLDVHRRSEAIARAKDLGLLK